MYSDPVTVKVAIADEIDVSGPQYITIQLTFPTYALIRYYLPYLSVYKMYLFFANNYCPHIVNLMY